MVTEREQVLYDKFSKGDYAPLIHYMIGEKWKKQEKIRVQSFFLELEKNPGAEINRLEFAYAFSACLELAVFNKKYKPFPGNAEYYNPLPYMPEVEEKCAKTFGYAGI